MRIAALALAGLLLTACSAKDNQIQITRAVLAPTPDLGSSDLFAQSSTREPLTAPTSAPVVTDESYQSATAALEALTPTVRLPERITITDVEEQGIRPGQAVQNWEAVANDELLLDWRPPPMIVPLSHHPDDHYWLVRPLASDSRNYDLETYQYGNVPTKPDTFPYRVHRGMDFPNSKGTPVFAASDGIVIYAGPLTSYKSGISYYGNTVIILHDWRWQDQNVYTLYAHTLELFVEVGDHVNQGQLIAGVGASGTVSGSHLHFEVRVGSNTYENTRNPALWLAPFEGWGTLAGRFIDMEGELIHGAQVIVRPVKIDSHVRIPTRRHWTYSPFGINSDDIWQENFVVSDLPAGEYTLFLDSGGNLFRRDVKILPGQTNFVVIQADFSFVPTPTPSATTTPVISGTITSTLTTDLVITPTLELTAPPPDS